MAVPTFMCETMVMRRVAEVHRVTMQCLLWMSGSAWEERQTAAECRAIKWGRSGLCFAALRQDCPRGPRVWPARTDTVVVADRASRAHRVLGPAGREGQGSRERRHHHPPWPVGPTATPPAAIKAPPPPPSPSAGAPPLTHGGARRPLGAGAGATTVSPAAPDSIRDRRTTARWARPAAYGAVAAIIVLIAGIALLNRSDDGIVDSAGTTSGT